VVNNSLLTWTEGRSVQSFARAVFALSPDSCRKARLTPAVLEKACPRLIYLPSDGLVAGHSTFCYSDSLLVKDHKSLER
jgi:hypothetical protein